MNWNFIIRLAMVVGILVLLFFNFLPSILTVVMSVSGLGIILAVFILLTFGIYKFLKAGLKKGD